MFGRNKKEDKTLELWIHMIQELGTLKLQIENMFERIQTLNERFDALERKEEEKTIDIFSGEWEI